MNFVERLQQSLTLLWEYLPALLGAGVVLTVGAWVVDKVATRAGGPAMERSLARRLRPLAFPLGPLVPDDETLLVQSGKPVGVLQTHEWAPRVLLANSNLVGDWANWPEFRRLEHLGLTMYGQMTAGSWIYIGTQGILQGTYETFAAVANEHFGGSLAGTLTVTAGCGGMGGAQPLAVTMNEGVCLIIDVDGTRLQRRVETRYLDEIADNLDAALARCEQAKAAREAVSVGLVGNAATIFPELLRRGVAVDIVTDQTSAHDPLFYCPEGVAIEDMRAEAERDPADFTTAS